MFSMCYFINAVNFTEHNRLQTVEYLINNLQNKAMFPSNVLMTTKPSFLGNWSKLTIIKWEVAAAKETTIAFSFVT